MIAGFLCLLVIVAGITLFFLPRFRMIRDLRRLFHDYGNFCGSGEEEREHWVKTARRYFERLGWAEGRIRNRLLIIRQAHEAVSERQDMCFSSGERVREFARRVLICQLVRQDEMLPLRQTERVYQLVEMEYRRFEARKGNRK